MKYDKWVIIENTAEERNEGRPRWIAYPLPNGLEEKVINLVTDDRENHYFVVQEIKKETYGSKENT